MAKVSGAAANQQLQPVNDGLSQSAQYWGGIGANMAKNNLAMAERNKQMREARMAQAQSEFNEKYKASDDALKIFDSKNNDLNTVIAKGVFRLKEMNAQAHDVLNPASGATAEQRMKATMDIQKIQQAIPYMKSMTQGFIEQITADLKDIQEGKKIATPEFTKAQETFFDLGSNNAYVDIYFDENFMPIVGYKKDGEEASEISYRDLVSGKFPTAQNHVSYETTVKFYKDLANSETKKSTDGIYDVTETTLNDDTKNMIYQSANELYSLDENGKPTPELASYLHDRGINPYSLATEQLNEVAEKLKTKFITDVSASVKTEDSRTKNRTLEAAYIRADSRDKSKQGLIYTQDTQSGDIETITVPGSNSTNGQLAYSVSNNNEGQPFILKETGASEERTHNIFVTDDGKYYGEVYTVEKGKKTVLEDGSFSFKNEIVSDPKLRQLTNSEISSVAIERGYKDANDMSQDLKNKRQNHSGTDDFGLEVQPDPYGLN